MTESRKVDEGVEAHLPDLAEYFDRTDAGELPWEEAVDVVIERRELEQISLRLPKDD